MARIAVPCDNERVPQHFGHAGQFGFFDVDPAGGSVLRGDMVDSPAHQPGVLPKWLAEQGATVVLATGIGQRAVQLLAGHGAEVITGIQESDPRRAVEAYRRGDLAAGGNICHLEGEHGCHDE